MIRFRLPAAAGPDGLPTLTGSVQTDDGVVTVESARPTADLQEVTSWAAQHGVELADLLTDEGDPGGRLPPPDGSHR